MKSIKNYRLNPKLFDFNYFVCRNNLNGIKILKKKLANKRKKILDIGCGMKPFASLFGNHDYIGIDFTIENTLADYVIDLNTQKLPFKDNSFDAIILSETMEHIYNNLNLVNEIKRVLRNQGLIYISTPFNFPEHGVPFDFYRFTKNYYFKTFEKYKLICCSNSNVILTTPLIYFNYIILPFLTTPLIQKFFFFKFFSFFFKFFILINNFIIYLIEEISNIILKYFKNKYMERYMYSSPIGYYFIYKNKK